MIDIEGIDEAEFVQIFARARQSLVTYRSTLLEVGDDEIAPAPFHFRWSDILLHGEKHFAIEGYRESAKTQYVMRAFPLYALTFPDKRWDYVAIIKANTKLAHSKLKEVTREYKENPVLSARLVRIIEDSGERFVAEVLDDKGIKRTVILEAYGRGGAVRGMSYGNKRPKIVIIDDPQDKDDMLSEVIPEQDWDWFLSDVYFLGKKSRIFLIANNLGSKCIIERVFEHREELGFECEKVRVLDENDEPSWPAANSKEDIDREQEYYRSIGKIAIWYQEKMCEAIADETRTFHRDDFQYYPSSAAIEIANMCNVFIRIDPAFKQKPTNDYTAIPVVGIDEHDNWFVLDCPYGRWNLNKKLDMIFQTVIKWRANLVNAGIEDAFGQSMIIENIDNEKVHRKCFFNCIAIPTKGIKKEMRIEAMQPQFKAKKVYFPDNAWWLPEMETELLLFAQGGTKAKHDDLIDALSMVMKESHKPMGQAGENSLMAILGRGANRYPRQSNTQAFISTGVSLPGQRKYNSPENLPRTSRTGGFL